MLGFVGGAALGARIGPALLPDGSESRYAPVVAVAAGILLGVFVAVALEGVGQAIRVRMGRGTTGALDGAAGAALLCSLALLIAWGFGAVALHAGDGTRDLRRAVQRSAILGALNDVLPPSGPLLNVLRRVDPTGAVRGPDSDVARPSAAALRDPDVRAAGASTVKVLGTSCGLGVSGSGWVAGPGLVVTNAHVLAGEEDTTVTPADGASFDATVVHYDTRNDLALLSVPELDAEPLELAARRPRGASAAVIGYPGNGPLTFTAARLGRTGRVTSQDSYGRGPVQRRMTPFRARVRPGSSGGPVVDRGGDVLTTVFAASSGEGRDDGLGVPNGVVARALQRGLEPTDTGPCAA